MTISEIKQIFSEIGIISAAQYKFMNSALNTKYSTLFYFYYMINLEYIINSMSVKQSLSLIIEGIKIK